MSGLAAAPGPRWWALYADDPNAAEPAVIRRPVVGFMTGRDQWDDATAFALVPKQQGTAEVVPATHFGGFIRLWAEGSSSSACGCGRQVGEEDDQAWCPDCAGEIRRAS